MSLVQSVIEAVIARGSGSIHDIAPLFPNHTRLQVHNALNNARDTKRLRVRSKGNGGPRVWEPTERAHVKPRKKPIHPVPSVFAMAAPAQWLGPWPPLQEGRRFGPLGGWD